MDFFVLKVISCKDREKIGDYLVHSRMQTLGFDEFTPSLKRARMFDCIDYEEAEKIQDFYRKCMNIELKIKQIQIKEYD